MNLTILSRSPAIYTTRRLMEAGAARHHNVRVLDPLKCEMHLDGRAANLFYHRASTPPTDVVIPRIAQSITYYGLSVLEQFQLCGVAVLNTPEAIAQSRNKMRCLQLLSANGIPIPPTVMASSAADLKEMVNLVGGVPVLIKLLQSGDKQGVMVCQSLQSMNAALEAILGLGHNLLIQQYVKEKGRDIRVLVVGGEVVVAVRRQAKAGRLRLSLTRGAHLEKIKLPAEFQRLALESARLVGLEVAAIDMLDVKDGPKVFEINSSPGLKDLEEATGENLADVIVARAEKIFEESGAESKGAEPKPLPARKKSKARRPAVRGS